jgi:hypothetical protein
MAHRWTEIIETYGEALKSRAKWQTDSADHKMILDHYESDCKELHTRISGLITDRSL